MTVRVEHIFPCLSVFSGFLPPFKPTLLGELATFVCELRLHILFLVFFDIWCMFFGTSTAIRTKSCIKPGNGRTLSKYRALIKSRTTHVVHHPLQSLPVLNVIFSRISCLKSTSLLVYFHLPDTSVHTPASLL